MIFENLHCNEDKSSLLQLMEEKSLEEIYESRKIQYNEYIEIKLDKNEVSKLTVFVKSQIGN